MEKIIKTYYSIIILDSCGDIYDELFHDSLKQPFLTLKETALKVIDMMKQDKELGDEFGVWYYRIGKHEETEDTDYQTVYKLYKYKGLWKCKIDEKF